MQKMISIITPVYNGEKFIEACIKIVIDQSCRDIEHIIVDGSSTDRTVEIIKQYADKYPHIRWISEKDKGQSDAMNKGIAMAKGQVLGILNVDDFYEPDVLNQVLEIFRSLPEPSFLVGNCNIWNDEGNIFRINKPNNLNFLGLLRRGNFPENPSAYFYHMSLHQKIGLYKVDEQYAMDYDFILRAVQVANIKYVNEIWGNFRFITGTKTFNDYQNDQGWLRYSNLISQYREKLSMRQKIQIFIREQISKAKHKTLSVITSTASGLKIRVDGF